MKSTIPVKRGKVYYYFLKTLNGLFYLSEREIDVLSEFMTMHEELLLKNGYSIPGVELFSLEIRKQIALNLGIKTTFLQNIIGGLRKKEFIIEQTMTLKLRPQLDSFIQEKMKKKNVLSVTFIILEEEDGTSR